MTLNDPSVIDCLLHDICIVSVHSSGERDCPRKVHKRTSCANVN